MPPNNERLSGCTEIDWIRSTTEVSTEHTKNNPTGFTNVKHEALFGIEPGTLEPIRRSYGKTLLAPLFLTLLWSDGVLVMVRLAGRRALMAGGMGKDKLFREFTGSKTWPINRDELPELVRDTIVNYERKVPVASPSPVVVQ